MAKDLTTSKIDRQNILNNELALNEIQEKSKIVGIYFEDKFCFTKSMVADYFEIYPRTLERYIIEFEEELNHNGYEILRGKRLKNFLDVFTDAPVINDGSISKRTSQLSIFTFKTFLNIAMLLAESDKAKLIRQFILDIVIDLLNAKTGIGTKYINQRDKDFISASLQEENYRRKFTDALKNFVVDDRTKYSKFTNMIYVSIFKENASEYKKILDLQAKEKVRDTLYSEILDIVSSYENGLAEEIKKHSQAKQRSLSIQETEDLVHNFEKMPLWVPFIQRGRTKMSSRDLALRDAFHYQLAEYIKPLEADDYNKFLGVQGLELEKLMEENRAVLERLKGVE